MIFEHAHVDTDECVKIARDGRIRSLAQVPDV